MVRAVSYAIRQFRHAPGFTAATVLTLAVGIGGTTAIFTLINEVMLRSLEVSDPETLYRIGDGNNCCVQGGPQTRWGMFSYPLYERIRAESPEFEQLTAFQAGIGRFGVRRQGSPAAAQALRSEYVAGNYFTTFGVRAYGGRLFTPEDDQPSAAPAVVLSHHIWQTTYGSDPTVVGSTFIIEGHPFVVIGITPPGFFGDTLRSTPPEIWLPLQQEPLLTNNAGLLRAQTAAWLRIIGRVKPGASVDAVGPRLTTLLRQWMEHEAPYPAAWKTSMKEVLPQQVIAIVPAGGGVGVMKEQYGESLQLLLGVCALVLLIACANVANLLLARAMARRTHTAVQLALGASRRRLVSDALVESVVLSLVGALAGLVVAKGASRLLLSLAFSTATFLPIRTSPSPLVLAFAFGVAVFTGLLFGTAPAWFATRTNPIEALRGSGRTIGDRSAYTRTALLIVQATLSVILVAGATMLARGLSRIEGQDLGYQAQDRVLVTINRPPAHYEPDRLRALYRSLDDRLHRLPGVQGAGLALYNPLTDNWGELIIIEGRPDVGGFNQNSAASWNRVSAHYLKNLGMTIVRGRGLDETDSETTRPVAVVNESFVKRFFKADEDPIGKHFGLDEPQYASTFEIVGVVRDNKFVNQSLKQPTRPMFFVSLAQRVKYDGEMMNRVESASHFIGGLMLVTKQGAGAVEPIVTRALGEVDPNLTVNTVRGLQQQVELAFDQDRAVASLAGLFGVVSLVLAAIGLYGLTSYSVAQRTNEFGIRAALGAGRDRIVRLVLRSAFLKVAVGLVLGVPLAVGAGRLLASRLYGVTFWDPLSLSSAAGLLLLCALIAALVPALRAAAIPPMRALRSE